MVHYMYGAQCVRTSNARSRVWAAVPRQAYHEWPSGLGQRQNATSNARENSTMSDRQVARDSRASYARKHGRVTCMSWRKPFRDSTAACWVAFGAWSGVAQSFVRQHVSVQRIAAS